MTICSLFCNGSNNDFGYVYMFCNQTFSKDQLRWLNCIWVRLYNLYIRNIGPSYILRKEKRELTMKYKTEGELNAGNLSPHPRVQHTHTLRHTLLHSIFQQLTGYVIIIREKPYPINKASNLQLPETQKNMQQEGTSKPYKNALQGGTQQWKLTSLMF